MGNNAAGTTRIKLYKNPGEGDEMYTKQHYILILQLNYDLEWHIQNFREFVYEFGPSGRSTE